MHEIIDSEVFKDGECLSSEKRSEIINQGLNEVADLIISEKNKHIFVEHCDYSVTHKQKKPYNEFIIRVLRAYMYPRRESNPNLKFRKLSFYPLNYRGRFFS